MMGLGNQMFQYAAGMALSLHLESPLKLHIKSYERYPLRKYELSEFFEIQPAIATDEDLARFVLQHPVRRGWNKLFPKDKIRDLPYCERPFVKSVYEAFYLF